MQRLKRFIAITITTAFLAASPAKVAMPQALKKEPLKENIMADTPQKAAVNAIAAMEKYYVTGDESQLKIFLKTKRRWLSSTKSKDFVKGIKNAIYKNAVVDAIWKEMKEGKKYPLSFKGLERFAKDNKVTVQTVRLALTLPDQPVEAARRKNKAAIEHIARNRKPLEHLLKTKSAEIEKLLLERMNKLVVRGKKKFADYFQQQTQYIKPFMFSLNPKFQETDAWKKVTSRLILRQYLLGHVSWWDPQTGTGNKEFYSMLSQLYGRDFKKIASTARTAPKNGNMRKYLEFIRKNLGDVNKPGVLSKPLDARLLIAAAVYLRQAKNLKIADLNLAPLGKKLRTVTLPGKKVPKAPPKPTQFEKNLFVDKLQNCFDAGKNQTIAKISIDMMFQTSSKISGHIKKNQDRATAMLFNMFNKVKNFKDFFSGLAGTTGKKAAYGSLFFYLHKQGGNLTEETPKEHLSTVRVVMRAYIRQWARTSHQLKGELGQIGKTKRGMPIVDGKPMDARDVLHMALVARRYSLRKAGKTSFEIPEWKKPKVKATTAIPRHKTQKQAEPLIQLK